MINSVGFHHSPKEILRGFAFDLNIAGSIALRELVERLL